MLTSVGSLNAALTIVLVAACTSPGRSLSDSSGSAPDASNGAGVAGATPTCAAQPDPSAPSIGGSATGEAPPTTLRDALGRGQLVMLGAVSSATLHPGAVIAAIGGTQYCQNFELGELQIARTIKGQTDSAVLANFGYLASCGPTLTAKPVGVECDLPGANERFQLSTRTVFVIAGPIQASGSNLMLYQVRWTFPIDSSDVVDLTSVNAGTMKLDDLVRTANSGG